MAQCLVAPLPPPEMVIAFYMYISCIYIYIYTHVFSILLRIYIYIHLHAHITFLVFGMFAWSISGVPPLCARSMLEVPRSPLWLSMCSRCRWTWPPAQVSRRRLCQAARHIDPMELGISLEFYAGNPKGILGYVTWLTKSIYTFFYINYHKFPIMWEVQCHKPTIWGWFQSHP